MSIEQLITTASINGVALHKVDELISQAELQQRACTELLRQEAIAQGLLEANDSYENDGIISEQAQQAIEQLLEQEIKVATPDKASCQRHFEANKQLYQIDQQVRARHILFAVTPGVDVNALRQKAEHTMLNLRCYEAKDELDAKQNFAKLAKELSNCPSAQDGGELGWLQKDSCAAEFAEAIFTNNEIGILSKLVMTRHGFHIVEILQRKEGRAIDFFEAKQRVAKNLEQQSYLTALRQYIGLLAGQSTIKGVELNVFDSPLVQ